MKLLYIIRHIYCDEFKVSYHYCEKTNETLRLIYIVYFISSIDNILSKVPQFLIILNKIAPEFSEGAESQFANNVEHLRRDLSKNNRWRTIQI